MASEQVPSSTIKAATLSSKEPDKNDQINDDKLLESNGGILMKLTGESILSSSKEEQERLAAVREQKDHSTGNSNNNNSSDTTDDGILKECLKESQCLGKGNGDSNQKKSSTSPTKLAEAVASAPSTSTSTSTSTSASNDKTQAEHSTKNGLVTPSPGYPSLVHKLQDAQLALASAANDRIHDSDVNNSHQSNSGERELLLKLHKDSHEGGTAISTREPIISSRIGGNNTGRDMSEGKENDIEYNKDSNGKRENVQDINEKRMNGRPTHDSSVPPKDEGKEGNHSLASCLEQETSPPTPNDDNSTNSPAIIEEEDLLMSNEDLPDYDFGEPSMLRNILAMGVYKYGIPPPGNGHSTSFPSSSGRIRLIQSNGKEKSKSQVQAAAAKLQTKELPKSSPGATPVIPAKQQPLRKVPSKANPSLQASKQATALLAAPLAKVTIDPKESAASASSQATKPTQQQQAPRQRKQLPQQEESKPLQQQQMLHSQQQQQQQPGQNSQSHRKDPNDTELQYSAKTGQNYAAGSQRADSQNPQANHGYYTSQVPGHYYPRHQPNGQGQHTTYPYPLPGYPPYHLHQYQHQQHQTGKHRQAPLFAPTAAVKPIRRLAKIRPYANQATPVSAEEIQEAIPKDASSVFHIMDRRVNWDSFENDLDGTSATENLHVNVPIYSMLRAWVQDDPYRQIPPYQPPLPNAMLEHATTSRRRERGASLDSAAILKRQRDESSKTFPDHADKKRKATVDMTKHLVAFQRHASSTERAVVPTLDSLKEEMVQNAKEAKKKRSRTTRKNISKTLQGLRQKGIILG